MGEGRVPSSLPLALAFAAIIFGVPGCACDGSSDDRDGSPELSGGDRDGSTEDGSAAVDASGPTVEVGTGRDFFEPLITDEVVEIVIGPQGGGRVNGYHIWGGVRVVGFNPIGVEVTFSILDGTTRELRATQTRIISLEPNGDGHVAYGIAPRVTDCCLVERTTIIMRAQVKDQDRREGSDERRVTASTCSSASGAPICP